MNQKKRIPEKGGGIEEQWTVHIVVLTTSGPVEFDRTRLIPADAESRKKLKELDGVNK